jgi:hypothetical protein
MNPPGTFFDVFAFRGQYVGTVNGRRLSTAIGYAGITRVGGHIDALITLRGSGVGPLLASAIVARGGDYTD